MDTWSIRFTNEHGEREHWASSMREEDAKHFERYLEEEAPTHYKDVKAFDRLAELKARYPVGSKVVHTTAPHLGIGVVEGEWEIWDNFKDYSEDVLLKSSRLRVRFLESGRTDTWVAYYIAPYKES